MVFRGGAKDGGECPADRKMKSESPRRTRFKTIFGILIVLCILANFFPRHGPPHFRYTGSDPSREVWNLGWPLVLAIYDPQYGLHVGPFACVVIPLECFIVAVGTFVSVTLWQRCNKSKH